MSSGRRVALTLEALNQHMTGKTRRLDILRKAPKVRRRNVRPELALELDAREDEFLAGLEVPHAPEATA